MAETQVIQLVNAHAIAVRRFDRAKGWRIHSISAGTAIRAATASGDEPEIGCPTLARILRRVGITQDDTNQRDARELFGRMVFNILMDNTDDHEKNHALLVAHPFEHGRLKLAPAYDVLPTNSGQGSTRSSSAARTTGTLRSITRCRSAMRLGCCLRRQQPRWSV